MIDVKKIYHTRFTDLERIRKKQLWKILCTDFLQQFILDTDTVLDLGAGQCEFINNINCGEKIAVDANRQIKKYAKKDIKIIIASVKHLKKLFKKKSIDVIFMSNFLEHLDSKEDVFRILFEAYDILKKGGRLLVMQPDIGLVGHEYWDFFDHKVPLTLASVTEVMLANNYKISFVRHPFLPYTTKTKYLPLNPMFLKLYLKLRPLHFIFGKQFFICAKKSI